VSTYFYDFYKKGKNGERAGSLERPQYTYSHFRNSLCCSHWADLRDPATGPPRGYILALRGSAVPGFHGADFCWAIKLSSIGGFDIRFCALIMF
jgi:hypothetical protein